MDNTQQNTVEKQNEKGFYVIRLWAPSCFSIKAWVTSRPLNLKVTKPVLFICLLGEGDS